VVDDALALEFAGGVHVEERQQVAVEVGSTARGAVLLVECTCDCFDEVGDGRVVRMHSGSA
jgi:hypothetical protein